MARPSLSTQQVADIRLRLCGAALEVYRREGYDAASLRRLATDLGTSYTQAYRVFENKDELFAAVRLGCYARFNQRLLAGDPKDKTPMERLYALAGVILAYVQEHPADYQLMFSAEQPPLERFPELLAIRQEIFDYLVGIAEQAPTASRLADTPRTIIHMAWVALHGLLSLHAAGQLIHGHTLEDLVEPMLRTIIGPLIGPLVHRPASAN